MSGHNVSTSSHRFVRWGAFVTIAYLAIVTLVGALNPDLFSDLKAEGWANFLSGIFAPLAFLWLVLGFFQQGDELRNSAEALRLQGEELRASVEQQEQLVRVTREQLEFEREQLEAEREEGKKACATRFSIGRRGLDD